MNKKLSRITILFQPDVLISDTEVKDLVSEHLNKYGIEVVLISLDDLTLKEDGSNLKQESPK